MEGDSHFSSFLGRLNAGDSMAEAAAYQRYVNRLIGLARSCLAPRFNAKLDPEDAVQSAFRSFFIRNAQGDFQFDGWDSLWALLARITVRKCHKQVEKLEAGKRDVKREVEGEDFSWQLVSREPTPDEAAVLSDLLLTLFDRLDEQQQQIVSLRLQQFTVEEISERVERTERTVYRVLELVKQRLNAIEGSLAG